jgi:hypothetical protein
VLRQRNVGPYPPARRVCSGKANLARVDIEGHASIHRGRIVAAIMTNSKGLLSEEMQRRVEDFARQQNREPADVVEEALNRYMAGLRLEKLGAKMEGRAIALGIKEEDVPGLVHEVRRENAERGR